MARCGIRTKSAIPGVRGSEDRVANIFRCQDCKRLVDAPHCECGSARLEVVGDLHLGALGLDAYLALDSKQLIIKKPSGQVAIELKPADFGC